MSSIESTLPAVPAAAARYAGPERRRFGARLRGADMRPEARVLQAAPAAADAASFHTDRHRVVDEVQEAVCAALGGDAALFDLLRLRVELLCARRQLLGDAAAVEIDRLLAVDIVERHFLACDKRRRLQRDLLSLARTLRAASLAG